MAMNPILLQALLYFAVFVLSIIFVGMIFGQFFWRYFRVRSSRGAKLLIRVRDLTKPYYCIGKVEAGDVVFKLNDKSTMRLALDKTSVFRDLGVNCIEYDPINKCVLNYNQMFESKVGVDPDKMNSLYLRALYRPSILDAKQQLMLVLLIFIILFTLAGLIMGYVNMRKINVIAENVGMIHQMVYNITQAVIK